MTRQAYNPLDKLNLARSIETELLVRPPVPLDATDEIAGAGIYAIYYAGTFAPYMSIRADVKTGTFATPIYVGKAIPKGGRKGGLTKDAMTGKALRDRLRQHASSITEASNLDLSDFHVRDLVVEDIWIPLGENMLIESFKPVWNRAIDGFGNKTPGRRRATQYRSPWDVLHPGRSFAEMLAEPPMDVAFLEKRIVDYFAGRHLDKLPKAVEQQIAEDEAAAEDAIDET